jgi:hypothetical protein
LIMERRKKKSTGNALIFFIYLRLRVSGWEFFRKLQDAEEIVRAMEQQNSLRKGLANLEKNGIGQEVRIKIRIVNREGITYGKKSDDFDCR